MDSSKSDFTCYQPLLAKPLRDGRLIFGQHFKWHEKLPGSKSSQREEKRAKHVNLEYLRHEFARYRLRAVLSDRRNAKHEMECVANNTRDDYIEGEWANVEEEIANVVRNENLIFLTKPAPRMPRPPPRLLAFRRRIKDQAPFPGRTPPPKVEKSDDAAPVMPPKFDLNPFVPRVDAGIINRNRKEAGLANCFQTLMRDIGIETSYVVTSFTGLSLSARCSLFSKDTRVRLSMELCPATGFLLPHIAVTQETGEGTFWLSYVATDPILKNVNFFASFQSYKWPSPMPYPHGDATTVVGGGVSPFDSSAFVQNADLDDILATHDQLNLQPKLDNIYKEFGEALEDLSMRTQAHVGVQWDDVPSEHHRSWNVFDEIIRLVSDVSVHGFEKAIKLTVLRQQQVQARYPRTPVIGVDINPESGEETQILGREIPKFIGEYPMPSFAPKVVEDTPLPALDVLQPGYAICYDTPHSENNTCLIDALEYVAKQEIKPIWLNMDLINHWREEFNKGDKLGWTLDDLFRSKFAAFTGESAFWSGFSLYISGFGWRDAPQRPGVTHQLWVRVIAGVQHVVVLKHVENNAIISATQESDYGQFKKLAKEGKYKFRAGTNIATAGPNQLLLSGSVCTQAHKESEYMNIPGSFPVQEMAAKDTSIFKSSACSPSTAPCSLLHRVRNMFRKQRPSARRARACCFSIRGMNIGMRIAGASIGFKRTDAPAGFKYCYVNNADELCLCHAANMHLRPEERLCQHQVKVQEGGLSVQDMFDQGHWRGKSVAIYHRGSWAAVDRTHNEDSDLAAQPELADIILALHDAPVAHFDALFPLNRVPFDVDTDVMYKRGTCPLPNKTCCQGVVSLRGGAAELSPEGPGEYETGDDKQNKQVFGTLFGPRIVAEARDKTQQIVNLGGYDDIFGGVDELVHLDVGSKGVDTSKIGAMVANCANNTAAISMAQSNRAQTVHITLPLHATKGEERAHIQIDLSAQPHRRTTQQVSNPVENSNMADQFKKHTEQLKSLLPSGTPNMSHVLHDLSDWTSAYDDAKNGGRFYLFEKLWAGLFATRAGAKSYRNEFIVGNGLYTQCWPHSPDQRRAKAFGQSLPGAANLNAAGLTFAADNVRNNVNPPNDNTFECTGVRQNSFQALWPTGLGYYHGFSRWLSLQKRMNGTRQVTSFNAQILSFRHHTTLLWPDMEIPEVGQATDETNHNPFVVLANLHMPFMNLDPAVGAGFRSNYLDAFGPADLAEPPAVGAPHNDREEWARARMQYAGSPFKLLGPFNAPADVQNPNTYSHEALSNYRSWFGAIMAILMNFGGYEECVAALNTVSRRSVSFFPATTTCIETSLGQRFVNGNAIEKIVRRRLYVMRHKRIAAAAAAPAPANPAAPTHAENQAHYLHRETTMLRQYQIWSDTLDTEQQNVMIGPAMDTASRAGLNVGEVALIQGLWGGGINAIFDADRDAVIDDVLNFAAYGDLSGHEAGLREDLSWLSFFARADITSAAAFADFTSQLSTQQATSLVSWVKNVRFSERWSLQPGQFDAPQVNAMHMLPHNFGLRNLRHGTPEQNADRVEHYSLDFEHHWGSVRRDNTLNVTNLRSDEVRTEGAGISHMRHVASGAFIHHADVRALKFAKILDVISKDEASINGLEKSLYMLAIYARLGTDYAVSNVEVSASVLDAGNGVMNTGNQDLDERVTRTSLYRRFLRYDTLLKKYVAAVVNAHSKVGIANSLFTELEANLSTIDFIGSDGWKVSDEHPEDVDSSAISWRVFSPVMLSLLAPGAGQICGGVVRPDIKCFDEHVTGSYDLGSTWQFEKSKMAEYELLGALKTYLALSGYVIHMPMLINYTLNVRRHKLETAQVWKSFSSRMARRNDQLPTSLTYSAPSLYFYAGWFTPYIELGKRVDHYDDPRTGNNLLLLSPLARFEYAHSPYGSKFAPMVLNSESKDQFFRQQIDVGREAGIAGLRYIVTDGLPRQEFNGHHSVQRLPVLRTNIQFSPASCLYEVGGNAGARTIRKEYTFHQTLPQMGPRAGGGLEGLKPVVAGTAQPGLHVRDLMLVTNEMVLGIPTPAFINMANNSQFSRSTADQFDLVQRNAQFIWNRAAMALKQSKVYFGMADEFEADEAPSLDFAQPLREYAVAKGRGNKFSDDSSSAPFYSPTTEEEVDTDRFTDLTNEYSARDQMSHNARMLRAFSAEVDKAKEASIDAAASDKLAKSQKTLDEAIAKATRDSIKAELAIEAARTELELAIKGKSAEVAELHDQMKAAMEEKKQVTAQLDALKKTIADLEAELRKAKAASKD